jgi:hypothetical protein
MLKGNIKMIKADGVAWMKISTNPIKAKSRGDIRSRPLFLLLIIDHWQPSGSFQE